MVSSTEEAAPSSPFVANASPLPVTTEAKMGARLLAAACSGSFQELESLLNPQAAASSNGAIGSPAVHPPSASGDVEALLRESLPYAVTTGGDTLLHVVANSHGRGEDFLNKARLIYSKAQSLLFVQNNRGDTPLHCAARASNIEMVSLFIHLARSKIVNASRVKALLRTENKSNETALHEAVKSVYFGQDDIVKLLMNEDSQLASFPKDGMSPLYLAILLQKKVMAKTLYDLSGGVISYYGPDGQNALHAAVLQDQVDEMKLWTAYSACNNQSLTWILNMQDNDGNTALHLAVRNGGLLMFCCLFWNIKVHLNLRNEKGQTPLDIARDNIPKGLYYIQNSEVKILHALKIVRAKGGIFSVDYLVENNIEQASKRKKHRLDQVKEGTQALCIGSVLIATVTFGATFAMPGGYRDGDHTNAGTPTLAGTNGKAFGLPVCRHLPHIFLLEALRLHVLCLLQLKSGICTGALSTRWCFLSGRVFYSGLRLGNDNPIAA
ncbi:ankyrin repeat-containing protein At5g02620-like [Triticum dicoccoides]|uniref:ankyrin repeat-containing protein At5g02620-like n=1 Tax=Triticum dicoccoides TaxID=85692 RepID=UPI001890F5C7|nr:ankyrin repeat-containing protein At5g02620-like [Triticum dicoccoides]